jgi:hypothetical protein
MMRKRNIIIAIAATVALTVAPIADAFARMGGGGGMGGHGGMGGMGGGRGMGMGGGMGGMGGRGMGFASHGPIGHMGPVGIHGNRFAFAHNRFAFRHHRFHNRFFFAGAPFAYASYYNDGCYVRVWGPYGWHWTNVCYY